MSIFRASDGDGQFLHGATVQELAERTPSLGTAAALWDIRQLDPDGQRGPKHVGYVVGGVFQAPGACDHIGDTASGHWRHHHAGILPQHPGDFTPVSADYL